MKKTVAERSRPGQWAPTLARKAFPALSLLGTLLALASPAAAQSTGEAPEAPPASPPWGHAHNDYYQPRPLLDALERGFGSVEVDIHLVGQELLVAHDAGEADTLRTLEGLYLSPLREWISRNDGVVHEGMPPLILLIDVKTDAEATYARLHPLLRRYADILTFTAGDRVVPGPVVAVISGNRPRSAMLAAPVRFASFDGRLADLEESASLPPSFMPLVSDNWARVSGWNGEGKPPQGLQQELSDLAMNAQSQGRQLRFWATPDRPEVWALLHDAGVHLINTDDLDGLRAFLQETNGDPE